MVHGTPESRAAVAADDLAPRDVPFEIVALPVAVRLCNAARLLVTVEAMGAPESPAGVTVLVDGRPTGVEAIVTCWTPELHVVRTIAVSDPSRLVARAIGDAIVTRAVARPFVDRGLRLLDDH